MGEAFATRVQRDARAVDDDPPDAADGAKPEATAVEFRARHAMPGDSTPRHVDARGLRRDRAGARGEVVDLNRAFLCDMANHEAPHDHGGDRTAGDAAVSRRVADDEKARRTVAILRPRSGRGRDRDDRHTCKKEENPAHFLLQSTPPAAAGTSGAWANLSEMSPGALQDRSERLASLVDELGAALRGSGVAADAAARVLESASAAVLDALTLDLMLPDDPPVEVSAPPVEEPPAEPGLPLAA